ncbi:MAG: caspase family protein, partial [Deltaproteobacteria bacterium]|nr:caspase family protein [Deltaproteobacteria bacterium]
MRTARPAKAPFRRAAPFLAPLAALALAIALPQAASAAKHALLIGINAYPDNPNFPHLTGALNDVELMRGVLVERLHYPEGNITALVDRQATRTGVIDAMTALAGRIAEGDEVYVQYSGHGSTTCDLSGDETRSVESTLVTYGSRSGATETPCATPNESEARAAARLAASDPDDYDLTDDRIRQLVTGLRRRAGLVIMVSDSCHSATITRGGDALPTRGVPRDDRVNPDAFLETSAETGRLGDLISIGAADITEGAVEYPGAGNGKDYGAFTWSWALALQAARRSDTWSHVLDRAAAYMNERGQGGPHPVFEETSPTPRLVFADGKGGSRAFTVLQTLGPVESGGKKRAIVNAGILAGVTPGTVFVKGDPEAPAARLTVARSSELQSMCEVTEGEAAHGDDVELFSWAPGGMSIKVRYRADLPGDEGLIPQARAIFEGMSMVEEASDPAEADMAVWILRPPAQAAAAPSAGSAPAAGASPPQPAPFLPSSDPAAPPEIWLVSPAEDSFLWGFDRLRAPLEGDGPDRLRANFLQAA